MQLEEIILEFKSKSNLKSIEGMARFGITPDKTFGIRIPELRKMAKR
ncbi:MAG: DNA alkylation repair protein, partial [Candidatus Heimdallarchaeaceae archaeon]